MDTWLDAISGAKTIQLVTYKRDGTPVATPVSIAIAGDRAFFRTYDRAGKVRRLRRDPLVEIAPATIRGRVTGPGTTARAVLLDGGQAAVAARALARRHRLLQAVLVPIAHRLRGYRTLHYELLPAPR
jgi:PPOX class probable F420-dependent enzyme